MAIVFSASLNTQQVEASLRRLPQQAQQAGREMGQNLGRATQAASASTTAYLEQMRRKMRESMASPQTDAARQKQRQRDQAENARATIALERDNERRARQQETLDRRMDNAKARTRETNRRNEERAERERAQGQRRLLGLATGGVGFFLGHQLVQAATEYGDALNRIQKEMGGITAEQGKQMAMWRQMASAAHTREQGLELRAQMAGDIQSEMERYRNESTDQGGLENISDFFSSMFGGQTFMGQRNDALASRIGAMEAAARSNMRIAQQRQSFLDSTRGMNATDQQAVFQNRINSLRGEAAGLNPDDPGQLRHIQRIQAEIKSLEPLRDKNRSRMLQERDTARDMLTLSRRQKDIESERLVLRRKIEDVMTPQGEREQLEARMQQLTMQSRAIDIERFNRTLDVGLMGAGGRRDSFRQLRREQREINRMGRLAEKGIKDARAFSDRLIDPKIGREAAIAQMGITLMVNIDRQLMQINAKLGDPSLS